MCNLNVFLFLLFFNPLTVSCLSCGTFMALMFKEIINIVESYFCYICYCFYSLKLVLCLFFCLFFLTLFLTEHFIQFFLPQHIFYTFKPFFVVILESPVVHVTPFDIHFQSTPYCCTDSESTWWHSIPNSSSPFLMTLLSLISLVYKIASLNALLLFVWTNGYLLDQLTGKKINFF